MLCDELIETYSNTKYETAHLLRSIDKKSCDSLVECLKKAQKFVLTKDVYILARESLWTKPIALLAVSDYIKPPFPYTWIEYDHSVKNPDAHIDRIRDEDVAPLTKRIGFLIQKVNEESFIISMGYSYKDPSREATMNQLSWIYNMDSAMIAEANRWMRENGADYIDEQARDEAFEENAALVESWHNGTGRTFSPKEAEAAKIIEGRMMPIICPYFAKISLIAKQKLGDKYLTERMIQCKTDWVGEVGVSQAVFIFLACKNAVEQIACQDIRPLNKMRKLRGKEPLCEYKTLELSLTAAQKKSYSECSNEDDKNKMRLHWVRGHFKRRKSGIFWWNPHMAGNREAGFIEKDYSVSA